MNRGLAKAVGVELGRFLEDLEFARPGDAHLAEQYHLLKTGVNVDWDVEPPTCEPLSVFTRLAEEPPAGTTKVQLLVVGSIVDSILCGGKLNEDFEEALSKVEATAESLTGERWVITTQSEFARRMNVDRSAVLKWLKDESKTFIHREGEKEIRVNELAADFPKVKQK